MQTVSDFYPAYDTVGCRQQKCLIHLIRDLNDNIFSEPFNNEIKEIGQDFSALLKPVIDTIDRFGLKTHFLRSHKPAVKRFFDVLLSPEGPHQPSTKSSGKVCTKSREAIYISGLRQRAVE